MLLAVGIFIDPSKALDTLDHNVLLIKLDEYGIRGTTNNLIKSYFSYRNQYNSVLYEESRTESIMYGVPQGSVLEPLLFLIDITYI